MMITGRLGAAFPRIRIGIMGCAAIARRSMAPAVKGLPDRFELVAAASRSEEKARAFAAQAGCEPVVGYERLLARSDLDAVYVPLPTGLHEEWVLRALDSGRHVLAEKSLAGDLASAERMVAKARQRTLLLMEEFMFCCHSQHEFVRKLLADAEAGELRVLRSSFGFPPLAPDNFRYIAALGGGALLDAGAYTLRAAQLFLGPQIRVLGAHLDMDPARGVDLGGAALLRDTAGVTAQAAFGFDHFYQCNYELWGSKGKIIVPRAFTAPPGFAPQVILEKHGKREEFTLPADDHFRNILIAFAESITSGNLEPHWAACLNQARLIQQVRNLCPQ